jgi:tetratricopeptide (TPR) repeat protein
MNETPKSTRLNRYSDAISRLPLEEQIARAGDIDSPYTLRRMLSDAAPDQLIRRFNMKMNEVNGLSHYEKGRIRMTQGPTFMYSAQMNMKNAILEGDPRGHMGLGRILSGMHDVKNDVRAVFQYATAIDAGLSTPELHTELGIIYQRHRHHEKANEQYELALERCDDPFTLARRIRGTTCLIIGDKTEGIPLLEENAAAGDFASVCTLIEHYYECRDLPNLERTMLVAAGMGDMKQLLELGYLHLQRGRYPEAEKYMVLAMKAGYPEALMSLWQMYTDNGDHKKAREVINEAVSSENSPAVLFLCAATILTRQKKYSSAKKASAKAMEKLGLMERIRRFKESGNNGRRGMMRAEMERDVIPAIQGLHLQKETLRMLAEDTDLDLDN